MTARTPACDVDIAGAHIGAGEMVRLFLGGANRDPKVFSDPTTFDVTRPNAREHLAFASGIHACLGAALARIEASPRCARSSNFPICGSPPPRNGGR